MEMNNCYFTNSSNAPWVFFKFFKLCKWMVPNRAKHHIYAEILLCFVSVLAHSHEPWKSDLPLEKQNNKPNLPETNENEKYRLSQILKMKDPFTSL